jgi:N6-adenosine-specific RNA methylase IME4
MGEVLRVDEELQELIPPLTAEEYRQLEENIIKEGCRDALVVWNDTILDGHNRYEICTQHGVEFQTVDKNFTDKEQAKDWIDMNQLGRRNLTPDQMRLLRGRRYNRQKRPQGGTGANQYMQKDQNDLSATADKLAKEHGVSAPTIKRDGKFYEEVEQLKEQYPDKIKEIFDGSKRANVVMKEIRRETVKQRVKESKPLDGKYRIIYADPPWNYGDKRDGNTTGAEDHYPSMTIEELCNLPIKNIAEDDAVLFLWVTSPLLEECFDVIRAWGFKYKTSFIWDKIKHNMGHYNSVRHELLLVCTRGKCKPDNIKLFDSVQSIERTEHSKKPEEFRQIIETLYEYGNKIELFARRSVDGWEVWGNEPTINR